MAVVGHPVWETGVWNDAVWAEGVWATEGDVVEQPERVRVRGLRVTSARASGVLVRQAGLTHVRVTDGTRVRRLLVE